MAYTFYYEDCKQPDGTLKPRKVRHFIGRVPDELSERAALREHDRIMQEVNRKRGSVAPTIKGRTFQDATESWRKAIAPSLSPSTRRQRESHLRTHILPKFADAAPHTLDAEALQQFATDLRKVLSRKTVVQVLITIFDIIAYAEKCRTLVAKVSLRDLKLGKAQKGPPAPFFTQSQVMRIIAAAKEPYKTLFAVAWYTGVRAGELLALTIDRLNFERKTIRIDKTCDDNNRQIRDTTKTDESTATLPMPSALETILRNYLQHHWKQNAAGYLFPNPSGTHPRRRDNVVKNGLKPLLRRLGIPCAARVGLHAFRHGLATELVESNVPLPIVQKQLRHADVTTTLRTYAHVVADTHRDVMERLGQRSISTNVPISTANFAN